jgi:hypothetical protein
MVLVGLIRGYTHMSQFKIADTLQTVCSSFQCSDYVITVGNYVNRNQYIDVNNISHTTTEVAGEIAQNSSTGPSRRNIVKPDIAASGNTLFASGEATTLASFTTLYPYQIALGGYHIEAGGTSASSPVVAGCAALYFQKNPTATSTQLKQAIINCSYSDIFTTTTLPNYRWGYGKLDAFQMMNCGVVTTNVPHVPLTGNLKIFPNPFDSQSTLSFSNSEEKNIYVYNTTGELVFSDSCKSSSYVLSKNNLAAGLYVMVCKEKNTTYRLKIIIL